MIDAERFWSRVDKSGECWIWTAGKFAQGYGSVCVSGKAVKAHRLAWELFVGPIPEGMCVLHKCDVRLCVRPDHLFIGSVIDNNADRDAKGRRVSSCGPKNGTHTEPHKRPFGLRNGNARLTPTAVLQIRADTRSPSVIAEEHGIHKSNVWLIKTRKAWAHLPDAALAKLEGK